jgi:hypothetical protein
MNFLFDYTRDAILTGGITWGLTPFRCLLKTGAPLTPDFASSSGYPTKDDIPAEEIAADFSTTNVDSIFLEPAGTGANPGDLWFTMGDDTLLTPLPVGTENATQLILYHSGVGTPGSPDAGKLIFAADVNIPLTGASEIIQWDDFLFSFDAALGAHQTTPKFYKSGLLNLFTAAKQSMGIAGPDGVKSFYYPGGSGSLPENKLRLIFTTDNYVPDIENHNFVNTFYVPLEMRQGDPDGYPLENIRVGIEDGLPAGVVDADPLVVPFFENVPPQTPNIAGAGGILYFYNQFNPNLHVPLAWLPHDQISVSDVSGGPLEVTVDWGPDGVLTLPGLTT